MECKHENKITEPCELAVSKYDKYTIHGGDLYNHEGQHLGSLEEIHKQGYDVEINGSTNDPREWITVEPPNHFI